MEVLADFDCSDAGLAGFRDAGLLHLLCRSDPDFGEPGRFVRTLDLSDAPVTDAGLAALADFPKVERLILRRTAVTDAGFERFRGLTTLVELDLAGTKVADRGLGHLSGLTNLEFSVWRPQGLRTLELKELRALKGLRRLKLMRTGVTDDGLDELGRMTDLTQIDLSDPRPRRPGLSRAGRDARLRHQSLPDTASGLTRGPPR